jgi:hypothetical protein
MSDAPKRHAPQGPKIQRDHMDASNHMDGSFVPCTATAKGSRKRCKRRPIPGGTVCVKHGGGAPQVQFKAMERLLALQPKAVGRMEALIDQEAFPTVAYAAARDVLDRTMGKPKETQALEHSGGITITHEMPE